MFETLKDKSGEIPQGFPWQLDEYEYQTHPDADILAASEMTEEDITLYDGLVEKFEKPITELKQENHSESEIAEAYEKSSENFVDKGFYLKGALMKSRGAKRYIAAGRLGSAERLYIEAIALDRMSFELTDDIKATRARFPNANVEVGEIINQDARVNPTSNLTIYGMLNNHYYQLLQIIWQRSGEAGTTLSELIKQRGISDLYRIDGSAAYNMKNVWFVPWNPFTQKKY